MMENAATRSSMQIMIMRPVTPTAVTDDQELEASTMEVEYLAENGDRATLWNSACGSFGKFCHKITASVAITFVALVCYVLLSIISSYKLFSKFDVPARH
ncbi:hypothetical protein TSUD_123870 [Trifolium subterraneum]|uniref:CASP-like protein n=1 Tax=Trifolium subterraneum TaxID=3900 RepID=A0A2Z6P4P4_TRISU|nr:hypothetical protein TSUD_123870 [Trifolium subterraneum]